MKITLDLKGMACPKPVLETQKAFKNPEITEFEVIVDNTSARENLKRLAASKGYRCDVSEEGSIITVTIRRETALAVETDGQEYVAACDIDAGDSITSGRVLMIKNEFLGDGNDELGKVLMKGFLYTVTETKPYPEKVVLLNSAIKLSTINEETVVHLKKLEEAGTKIYSCGTCLNYYDLADQLKVGVTGNMYDVVDSLMSTSDRIIL